MKWVFAFGQAVSEIYKAETRFMGTRDNVWITPTLWGWIQTLLVLCDVGNAAHLPQLQMPLVKLHGAAINITLRRTFT